MRIFKRIIVLAIVFAAAVATSAPAEARNNAFLVRLGGLIQVKPDTDGAFIFGTQGEYGFAGPFYFVYGGQLGVNGDYFRWDVQLGLLLKFRGATRFEPTLRGCFMFGGVNPFDKHKEGPYLLGSSFGLGVRYRFENGAALGLELGGEVGRAMYTDSERKLTYGAIVPTVGFEF